ncbi:MAG: serine/threonine-protein phosphatase, partial [Calditrichaeota bacterium]|nr:serine/threonine-protein phosphatase [Calditrichota bacterium]
PVVTVIAKLNNFLVEATSTGHYVTFFYGVLDRRKRRFVYCNAGHNPPILMRKDRSIHYLNEGGVVLGFLANQQYTQAVLELEKGDYLCFYTDGITEIQNPREEEYGEERLVQLLRKNYGKSPKEIRLAIVEEITQFAKSLEYQDDVTLLIVQVE